MSVALAAARRRPAAVVAVFLVEAIASWMIAAPWAETLARVTSAHPDGDRALFAEPGMPNLLDLERRLSGVFGALFAATSIGLAVYAFLSIVLTGALLAALGDRNVSLSRAVARGMESFFRLFGIGVVASVATVLVLVLIGIIPAYSVSQRFTDPRYGALASLVPLSFAAFLIALILAAADLARARVVAEDRGAFDAVTSAARDSRGVLAQTARALPRWIASLGLLGYGAALSTRASSIALIFLVHQAIALLRVGLRASVLARALRTVGAPSPSPSDAEEAA